jgi:hypothetical protein
MENDEIQEKETRGSALAGFAIASALLQLLTSKGLLTPEDRALIFDAISDSMDAADAEGTDPGYQQARRLVELLMRGRA